MSSSSTGERLYRARRTVLQMLRDRGYMVDEADVDQPEEDFFDKFTVSPQRDMLTLLVQKRDDPTDQIFVFWPVDPKVGVKPIPAVASKIELRESPMKSVDTTASSV